MELVISQPIIEVRRSHSVIEDSRTVGITQLYLLIVNASRKIKHIRPIPK